MMASATKAATMPSAVPTSPVSPAAMSVSKH
jgi:hypothetical protein